MNCSVFFDFVWTFCVFLKKVLAGEKVEEKLVRCSENYVSWELPGLITDVQKHLREPSSRVNVLLVC